MKRSRRYLMLAGLILALVTAFSTVHADSVFVVTTTAVTDDGVCDADCSLVEAINAANADPDLSSITFNIPGTGIQIILINKIIMRYPTIIDGTTQPGYSGTPLIEFDGESSTSIAIENQFFPPSGSGSTIRGLAIINYGWGGIYLDESSNNTIESNYIGVVADGITAAGNGLLGTDLFSGSGITLDVGSDNNLIRGNVISANQQAGILLSRESNNNIIENNRIGTNGDGTAALGSQIYGIAAGGAGGNRIGGTTPGARNIISGNQFGIVLARTLAYSPGNLIEGNYIGTDITGMLDIGNLIDGIRVGGSFDDEDQFLQDDVIGGISAGAGNLIAYNGTGVVVDDIAQQIPIEGNSIYANTGLGIDLAADGVTPNDTGDADSGPNNLQNFPLLTSAEQTSNQLVIKGQLNSNPNLTYRIGLFANQTCDASGSGEGETYLDALNVTTNSSGNASFSQTVTLNSGVGESITATATDPDRNTSEFSPCIEVASPPNAAPTPNYFATHTPTLTWTNVPGATGYELQVDIDSTFTAPYTVDDADIPADMLSKTTTLDNGTYYWRVRARLPDGKFSAWSAAQSFVVAA